MKLPAHRARLPGNEISFLIVPLHPAYKAGLEGHLPANFKPTLKTAKNNTAGPLLPVLAGRNPADFWCARPKVYPPNYRLCFAAFFTRIVLSGLSFCYLWSTPNQIRGFLLHPHVRFGLSADLYVITNDYEIKTLF
jgi:hypothetical protein